MNDKEQTEKKVIVRQMKRHDFKAIVQLQKSCFPNMDLWTTGQLENHIRLFPKGQICVEYDDQIVGSSSSLLVNFNDYLEQHSLPAMVLLGNAVRIRKP